MLGLEAFISPYVIENVAYFEEAHTYDYTKAIGLKLEEDKDQIPQEYMVQYPKSDDYWFEYPLFGNPIPNTDEVCEVKEMNEKENLRKEITDSLIGISTDINQFNASRFIEYCEHRYKMSTSEFLRWYEENGFEGNADMKLWAMFSKD